MAKNKPRIGKDPAWLDQNRGPFSVKDELYVIEHLDQTDSDIAKKLKRSEKKVSEIRAQKSVIKRRIAKDSFILELHAEYFWADTKLKLLSGEIGTFEHMYAELSLQFSAQEIPATEKFMIQDLILQDIFLSRSQKEDRSIRIEIQNLDQELREARTDMANPTKTKLENIKILQRTLDSNRATLGTIQRAQSDLQKNKDSKLKDLKGTRSQRLDKIQKEGKTLYDILAMLNERDLRESEGRILAISTKAAEIKKGLLMDLFEYENDTVDSPLLNSDTIKHIEKDKDEN